MRRCWMMEFRRLVSAKSLILGTKSIIIMILYNKDHWQHTYKYYQLQLQLNLLPLLLAYPTVTSSTMVISQCSRQIHHHHHQDIALAKAQLISFLHTPLQAKMSLLTQHTITITHHYNHNQTSYYTSHGYQATPTTLPVEMLVDLHEDADVTVYHDDEGNDEVEHGVDTWMDKLAGVFGHYRTTLGCTLLIHWGKDAKIHCHISGGLTVYIIYMASWIKFINKTSLNLGYLMFLTRSYTKRVTHSSLHLPLFHCLTCTG